MEAINNIVSMLNGPIWGVGMLVLIVGSGLYFTIRLGFFQFVHFKDMWSRIIDKSESESGISSFASFCTTMAMRVGTGNVAGVAVALYMGGPGALFWMIIAGMTNSAVCFTECTLSVLYKNRIDGQYRSGGAYCAEVLAGKHMVHSTQHSSDWALYYSCRQQLPIQSAMALTTL